MTCSACPLSSSGGTVNPRAAAAANASIGGPWLWHAKHVFCSACPAAPFVSGGSAASTAARTAFGVGPFGGAVSGTSAASRKVTSIGGLRGGNLRYTRTGRGKATVGRIPTMLEGRSLPMRRDTRRNWEVKSF